MVEESKVELPIDPPKSTKSYFIMLIGANGAGKSSVGNLLLDKNGYFSISDLMDNCTEKPKTGTCMSGGNLYTIMDTPGYDYEASEQEKLEIKERIMKGLIYDENILQIDCLILVHKYRGRARFSELINLITTIFDESILQTLTIIVTNYDSLVSIKNEDELPAFLLEYQHLIRKACPKKLNDQLMGINFIYCPTENEVKSMNPQLKEDYPKQREIIFEVARNIQAPYFLQQLKERREKLFVEMDRFLRIVIKDPEPYITDIDKEYVMMIPLNIQMRLNGSNLEVILGSLSGVAGSVATGFGLRIALGLGLAELAGPAGIYIYIYIYRYVNHDGNKYIRSNWSSYWRSNYVGHSIIQFHKII